MQLTIVIVSVLLLICHGFISNNKEIKSLVHSKLIQSNRLRAVPTMDLSLLDTSSMITSLLRRVDPSEAKGEFYFFFFGGSGALGIGFKQIPELLKEAETVKALANGKTLGGEALQCTPLATIGYPEPLRVADVQKIVDKMPSMQKISDNGAKKSYMAQLGYLEREAFYKTLPDCNPLALYAAFDAMAGGGGDLAAPGEAQAMVSRWKTDGLDSFKGDLLKATVKKYSAYVVFAFLIALVLDLIVESGINAFL